MPDADSLRYQTIQGVGRQFGGPSSRRRLSVIADQLVTDYRAEVGVSESDSDALAIRASWPAAAGNQGEEFAEDD